ncbi:hypothetical protein Tco_0927065 [Tanacetum coccineum]|uniref:Uncharacterized protein n=1 Tax=Tanacetum coccineum TaxID=301880 RepID=A0ABQ5DEF4_9ASTR
MRPGIFLDVSDDARYMFFLALRTTVVEQRALISGLQAADHQRQVQLTMALKLLKGLQTQMAEFQRQQGPAEGPAQPDAPEEAGARDQEKLRLRCGIFRKAEDSAGTTRFSIGTRGQNTGKGLCRRDVDRGLYEDLDLVGMRTTRVRALVMDYWLGFFLKQKLNAPERKQESWRTSRKEDVGGMLVENFKRSGEFRTEKVGIAETVPLDKLAWMYIKEVVRSLVLPVSIICGSDPRLSSISAKVTSEGFGGENSAEPTERILQVKAKDASRRDRQRAKRLKALEPVAYKLEGFLMELSRVHQYVYGAVKSWIGSQTIDGEAWSQLSNGLSELRRGPEFTWEREDQFRKEISTPLFQDSTIDKCHYIIMSDSEHSTITYLTELEYSDMGSPGVDGPPSPDYIPGPEAPPSPDYVPGPEAPPSPIYIPYVPEPEYPEFMPPEDHVFPAEEQPLPAVVSPTADSPGYIPESDPEGDPEDEEDPEEDPAYYPADIGDDDEEDEEEEHLASADSTVVALPAVDRTDSIFFISYSPFPQTPSPPPPQILSPPISPTRIEIPESCLPPRKRPRLASPTPIYEVGTREDLYKFVDMVDDAPRHPGCPISRELDYGITDEWDGLVEAIEEIAPTTIEGVNRNITDLSTTFDQETTIMHGLMEDAETIVMVEREAWMAREAWGFSMDVSDDARSHVLALRTTVVEQRALISGLQAADHQRQVQLTMALQLLKGLQTQMAEFQRQQGPAEGPAQPDAPEEAGSCS